MTTDQAVNEHYARLYGPTMLVAQHKINDIQEKEELAAHENVHRLEKSVSKQSNQPPGNYETERKALLRAFAGNNFDRFRTRKFDTEDSVKEELQQHVENRTKLLWKVAIKATDKQSTATTSQEEGDPLLGTTSSSLVVETEEMSIKDKIKKAYDKSKSEFK